MASRKSESEALAAAEVAAMAAQLADMASELAELAESDELRRRALGRMVRIFGADVGLIAPWDRQGNAPGRIIAIGGETAGQLRLEGLLKVMPEVTKLRRARLLKHPPSEVGLLLESLLAVPLVASGELDGILLLGTKQGGRRFGETELQMARLAGNFSAAVIGHATDFERFSRDLRVQIVEATQELSRLMSELQRVKSFNEDIFDSIGMGILVFDRSFGVVFRNRRGRSSFPDSRSVIEGFGQMQVPEVYGPPADLLGEVVRLGQTVTMEGVRYRRPKPAGNADHGAQAASQADAGGDNHDLVLHVSANPLLAGGGTVIGGILTLEDVTSDISMQRRLAASERLAAVGRLAAKVAHELNNPLDGILRYINLAARVAAESGDKRPAAYLDEARTGLMRMARIISELLEFSRSTVRTHEAVDLRTALDDARKTLTGLAERHAVEMQFEIEDNVPPLESAGLYQVFTNLMKNAIEAMPDGGTLRVTSSCAAGAVELCVGDSGPGIPADRLKSIFEPFFSTKQPGQGTGLGLAICQELVEKHGGTLIARNRAEGGAEFVIRIPTSICG